jgi:hypothetical protein
MQDARYRMQDARYRILITLSRILYYESCIFSFIRVYLWLNTNFPNLLIARKLERSYHVNK